MSDFECGYVMLQSFVDALILGKHDVRTAYLRGVLRNKYRSQYR